MIARRGFLSGLAAILAAPAVVKAASLMQVRGIVMPIDRNAAFGRSFEVYRSATIEQFRAPPLFRPDDTLFRGIIIRKAA